MKDIDMKTCIDTDFLDVSIAREHCPQNYHIEFTSRGYVIYVLNGYYYDKSNDICYKI